MKQMRSGYVPCFGDSSGNSGILSTDPVRPLENLHDALVRGPVNPVCYMKFLSKSPRLSTFRLAVDPKPEPLNPGTPHALSETPFKEPY